MLNWHQTKAIQNSNPSPAFFHFFYLRHLTRCVVLLHHCSLIGQYFNRIFLYSQHCMYLISPPGLLLSPSETRQRYLIGITMHVRFLIHNSWPSQQDFFYKLNHKASLACQITCHLSPALPTPPHAPLSSLSRFLPSLYRNSPWDKVVQQKIGTQITPNCPCFQHDMIESGRKRGRADKKTKIKWLLTHMSTHTDTHVGQSGINTSTCRRTVELTGPIWHQGCKKGNLNKQ